MILTNEERLKFIAYLRQNIESSRLIVEQMKTLPSGHLLSDREKTKMAAWMVVTADLESMELCEIKAETNAEHDLPQPTQAEDSSADSRIQSDGNDEAGTSEANQKIQT